MFLLRMCGFCLIHLTSQKWKRLQLNVKVHNDCVVNIMALHTLMPELKKTCIKKIHIYYDLICLLMTSYRNSFLIKKTVNLALFVPC